METYTGEVFVSLSKEGKFETKHVENKPYTGMMKTMGYPGDVKLVWDKNNTEDVNTVREQFKALLKKGYMAFRVNKAGDKGVQMYEFEANAESVILTLPMQGG